MTKFDAPTWGTDMDRFFQQVVDGLGSGAIYASLALALVLIYRSTGVLNFAQGEMAMFSTYVAWQFTDMGVGVWGALAIALVISFISGMAIERVVIRPVEGADHLTIVIVTLGLFFAFTSLAGFIWTYITKSFPSPFPDNVWSVGDVRLTGQSIGTLVVLGGVVSLLNVLFRRTGVGLAMRGAACNVESASLVGVRVGRMLMLGWGLAAALGALAGVMVAPRLFLEPTMMLGVITYAFAAATLGGLDSPLGAVLGGLIVGVSENLASTYVGWVGSDLKILVPLGLIIGVLLIRPDGLFGSAKVVRV